MSRRPHTVREIHRAALPNGVRVITEYMPHVRSVSVGIWIGTGSREEGPNESGISHFIEHMVFKGTKNRSAEQIARSVDSIGGGLDAFTSKELVSYNVKVLDEHLPEAFDVVADLVRNPLTTSRGLTSTCRKRSTSWPTWSAIRSSKRRTSRKRKASSSKS